MMKLTLLTALATLTIAGWLGSRSVAAPLHDDQPVVCQAGDSGSQDCDSSACKRDRKKDGSCEEKAPDCKRDRKKDGSCEQAAVRKRDRKKDGSCNELAAARKRDRKKDGSCGLVVC